MPEISLILPVYNSAKYFDECINSIKNQTFSDYECIMIDDGSADESAWLCDKICSEDSRFVVIHSVNRGPSAARNLGLSIASGKYVAFSDSDDIMRHQMLEMLLYMIQESGCDAAFADLQTFGDASKPKDGIIAIEHEYGRAVKYKRNKIFENYTSLTNCNHVFYGYMFTKIFRKHLFEGLRFPEDIRCYEDVYIMADIISGGSKFITLDLPIYYYRDNPDSLLRGGQREFSKKYGFFVYLCHTADVIYKEGYKDEGDKILFQFVYSYLEYIWKEFECNKGIKEFRKFIRDTRELLNLHKSVIRSNQKITRMYRCCLFVNRFSTGLSARFAKFLFTET